jgi:hypothetical protein
MWTQNSVVSYIILQHILDFDFIKTRVDSHKDLGVTITSDLSWSEHIIRTVKRANTSSYVMFKAFSRPSKTTFLKIYKSYILPLLEYANVIWSPTLIRDIKLIEKVQRKTTKRVWSFRHESYDNRIGRLKLLPLGKRRKRGDLIWTFKVFNIAKYSSLQSLFRLTDNSHLRGHKLKLKMQCCTTNVRRNFFPNRVFAAWNELTEETVSAVNLNVFKSRVDNQL